MSLPSSSTLLKLASFALVATVVSFAAKANTAGIAPTAYAPAPEAQAGNAALAQFRQVLERYGSVAQHPRYGEVWIPAQGSTVPAGWSPYPGCRWVYDQQQNAWSYQDPTEWGSIVHHFGRWAFDGQWMWIADANFGPGHVYWKNEGASVSWAALTPDIDNTPVPPTGWHSQDQQTFSAGCRQAAPAPVAAAPSFAPAPVAFAPPPPAFAPRFAPPVQFAPPIRQVQVVVPFPRPPQVVIPFPQPNPNPGPVHPCVKNPNLPFCSKLPPAKVPGPVADGGSACQMFPNLPHCSKGPKPGPVACPLDSVRPECFRKDPKPMPMPMPRPVPTPKPSQSDYCKKNPFPGCAGPTGGIAAGICAINPAACKPKPTKTTANEGLCIRIPSLPQCRGGVQPKRTQVDPAALRQHHLRLDLAKRTQVNLAQLQQQLRPNVYRPQLPLKLTRPMTRPTMQLPQRHVFRPNVTPRPQMSRPSFSRPSFGGGGMKFAGRGGRR